MKTTEIKYTTNYLTEVILRVDFTVPLTNLERKNLDAIKDDFSSLKIEAKENPIMECQVNLEQKSTNFETTGIQVVYELAKERGRFVLQNDLFSLQLNKYSTFGSLKSLFNRGFESCTRILEIKSFKRIGLRYINVFRLDEVKTFIDWKKFIKIPYVSIFEDLLSEYDGFTLRKSMNNFVVSNGEYTLQVNVGIWNDAFPKRITDHQFIVDIDCYSSDMIFSIEDFHQRLPQMNILCVNTFRQIINEELEAKLIKE